MTGRAGEAEISGFLHLARFFYLWISKKFEHKMIPPQKTIFHPKHER